MAHLDTLISTAGELCSQRRCGEAVSLWEEAASLNPGDAYLHYQLGFCCAGTCGSGFSPDSEMAIYHFRRALAVVARENRLMNAMILGALGNSYLSGPPPSKGNTETAIDCYERASQIYLASHRMAEWAREQFNLGNAWCEMPASAATWQTAIAHYERALSVRTRQSDPAGYAATIQNLGTAYRELPLGDRSANIRNAVECYHQAMRALPIEGSSKKRGDLHHNLGNAFLTLAGTGNDRARNLSRALHHLSRAITSRTKVQFPFDYAATQLSRGQAYIQLALHCGGGPLAIRQARVCLEEARNSFKLSGRADLADTAEKLLRLAGARRESEQS